MEARQRRQRRPPEGYRIVERLGTRNIVLIGMMGAGKSSVGRRLAQLLHLPFVDADIEIEKAANLTIAEIFAHYGEAHFREGEQRVLARLLADRPEGAGDRRRRLHERGDAASTAARNGITIWLKADVPVLLERVAQEGQPPAPRTQATRKLVLRDLLARTRADLCARRHHRRLA